MHLGENLFKCTTKDEKNLPLIAVLFVYFDPIKTNESKNIKYFTSIIF
jgi:hypothetical protein